MTSRVTWAPKREPLGRGELTGFFVTTVDCVLSVLGPENCMDSPHVHSRHVLRVCIFI